MPRILYPVFGAAGAVCAGLFADSYVTLPWAVSPLNPDVRPWWLIGGAILGMLARKG